MKIFLVVAASLICSLINLFITFSLLSSINADRLLWFLFWVNIPLMVLVQIASKLLENNFKNK